MVLKQLNTMNDGDIVKEGHLKRLKTQKKRYFVLRSSPRKGKSRLEYYESETKFRQRGPPKRVIYLGSCLNIAKKEDSKHKSVFALYTREDAFGLIADSEDELNSWLKSLQIEQRKDQILNASVSTWPVTVKPRGLGTSKNLAGQYDLQLSSLNLALVTKDRREPVMELQLVNIRRCGHTDCFFFMELGRGAPTGAGELWIQVDDQIIAQNMHEAILGPMHNISISGDVPSERRRCVSEGKRGRGKLRPVSAVIYPTSRGRSDTEPSSPMSPYRASPSSSTKNVSLSESPKGKQSSVINRLMSRRRSKDANSSVDSSSSNQEDTVSANFSHKVLMSPPPTVSPSVEEKGPQQEYVNVGPEGREEPSKAEDYVKMVVARRHSSDCYMDMEPSKSKKAFRDQPNQPSTKTTQNSPEEDYLDMSSLRQQAEKQKKTSSPKQPRTSAGALPNKPDIREFVCIKKSPSSTRRRSSRDYIDMSPLAVPNNESRSYVNFVPGSNSKGHCSSSDLTNGGVQSPSYVNFIPGENLEKRGREREPLSPPKLVYSSADSSSYEEMHSYVNFSPGKIHDKTPASSNFRKHSLESILTDQQPEYINVDFSGIVKSKSAVDMPEYINFVPGRLFESSKDDSSVANGETERSTEEELDCVNFSPGKVVENERWRKSPRCGRRDSEPARLQPVKCFVNSTLDSTKEDDETRQLNYAMLDLSKDEATPESPSRRRPRPPSIDLSSCRRASPGPRSAPIKSAYAEVDFTKSHGIRQAREETRELANTAV